MAGNMYGSNGAPTGYGQPRKNRGVNRRAIVDGQTDQLLQPQVEPGRVEGPVETPATPPPPAMPGRDQRDQLQWGNTGTMSGFQVGSDYGGDLKARNSVKNTFGRLASGFANTPEGLRQLVQSEQFKQYFPQAKLLEGGAGDKIDFGGVLSDFESGSPVGIVDVGQAFDPRAGSGAAWAWMPDGADNVSAPANNLYNMVQSSILGQQNQQGQQNPQDLGYGLDPSSLDQLLQYLMQSSGQGLI